MLRIRIAPRHIWKTNILHVENLVSWYEEIFSFDTDIDKDINWYFDARMGLLYLKENKHIGLFLFIVDYLSKHNLKT